jgi:hypothetical protein
MLMPLGTATPAPEVSRRAPVPPSASAAAPSASPVPSATAAAPATAPEAAAPPVETPATVTNKEIRVGVTSGEPRSASPAPSASPAEPAAPRDAVAAAVTAPESGSQLPERPAASVPAPSRVVPEPGAPPERASPRSPGPSRRGTLPDRRTPPLVRSVMGDLNVVVARDPDRVVSGQPTSYTVRLTSASGSLVTEADVAVRGRMSDGSLVQAPLAPTADPGTYHGVLVFSPHGPWDLRLRIARRGSTVEVPLANQVAW